MTPCESCSTPFEFVPLMVGAHEFKRRKLCEACREKQRMGDEAARTERDRAQLAADWLSICPPLYDNTDVARLAIPDLRSVLSWQPNPQGVALVGASGKGKTRAMFLLLKRLHFERVNVMALSAKRLERYFHKMFDKDDDASKSIAKARQCAVLFIDDVGKEKFTERVASEFYDLVEHRTSHLRPILWTSNASGEAFARMLGDDKGEPVVRRLREFSDVRVV